MFDFYRELPFGNFKISKLTFCSDAQFHCINCVAFKPEFQIGTFEGRRVKKKKKSLILIQLRLQQPTALCVFSGGADLRLRLFTAPF